MKKIFTTVFAIAMLLAPAFAGTGITGFLPQKTGFKQNFTPDEIADYAFQGAKPDITPSNKFWSDNYDVYASYLKDQIVTWMRAETGNANLSEAQAETKFRKMPVRKASGMIEATGLSINQATGEILGLAQPIERPPYETTDGLGEYEIYGSKGVMSCVCCNTHLGIETGQTEPDEWEDEAPKPDQPAPKKNVDSKKFNVPAGSEITINNYNYAYGGDANADANADAKANAKNEAPKTAYYDGNEDPGVVTPKPKPKPSYHCPYCGYSDCDGSCNYSNSGNTGCNNCNKKGIEVEYIVYQQKNTPGQKLANGFNTIANIAGGAGQLMDGIAGIQGKKGVRVFNQITNILPGGNNNDDGGDGGQLPTDDPAPQDLNGDGGNLPSGRSSLR
jgi:hypothetical protein